MGEQITVPVLYGVLIFYESQTVCGMPVLPYIDVQGVQSRDVTGEEYRNVGVQHFCVVLILSKCIYIFDVQAVF